MAISLKEVGIDIELRSRPFPNSLINHIINKDDIYDNDCLLKKWVEKESYLKYLGTGINMEIKNVYLNKKINRLFYIDKEILFNCFSECKVNRNILYFTIDNNNHFILK